MTALFLMLFLAKIKISDSCHANFDLVSDTPSDVVNQGLDTIFGEEKIMIVFLHDYGKYGSIP